MSGHIRKRPAVYADLEEIAVQIGVNRPQTAFRFLDAAEERSSLNFHFWEASTPRSIPA